MRMQAAKNGLQLDKLSCNLQMKIFMHQLSKCKLAKTQRLAGLPPGKIVFGADSVPEWRLGTRPPKLLLLIRAHFYGFESGSQ